MIKKCLVCQNEFTKGIKQFCSAKCYKKNYHKIKYFYKSKNIEKKCAYCDRKYTDRGNKYCSKECREESMRMWRSTRIAVEKECFVCKNKFTAMHKKTKYCSLTCRNKGIGTRVIKKAYKKCRKCGNEFEVAPGKLYCSAECKPVINRIKEEIKLICRVCGKDFYGHKHYVFCSKVCKKKYKNRTRKRSKKGKACEYCGFNNPVAIHAHHINREENDEVMFLCANHHYVFHSLVPRGKKSENKSKEEVLDVLRLYDKTGVNIYGIPKEEALTNSPNGAIA